MPSSTQLVHLSLQHNLVTSSIACEKFDFSLM